MNSNPEGLIGGTTRRRVLKAGAALSGGVAVGGTAIPTAAATRTHESETIVPVHHFVRAEGADDGDSPFVDPTPAIPGDEDLLVERTQNLPVDDGTEPETVDGEIGQLTWDEFSDIEGRIRLKCLKKGTHVSMHLRGLVPRALYTAWVVVFDSPGFVDDRNLSTAMEHVVGWAPLGQNDGSQNVFRPSASGEAQITAINRPDTWPNGPAAGTGRESETCLLDEYEVHIIGGWHLDGQTHGPQFRPNAVEQFAFVAVDGELV